MPTYTKHTPGTTSWIDLATPDQDGAKSFYADLFGWTYEDIPIAGTDGQAVYTMASLGGETVAGIFAQPPAMQEQGIPPMWQVYLTVEDADATVDKAKELGATLIQEPFDIEPTPGMNLGRVAVMQDPGGANICLWQPRTHIGSSVKNENGALLWAEDLSGDKDAAVKFYAELFGLTAMSMPGMDEGYYMLLMAGEEACFGVMNMPEQMEGAMPHFGIYMQVTDIDEAVELAASKGATVVNPPMDAPGIGRIAHIRDPQGANLAFTQPEQQ